MIELAVIVAAIGLGAFVKGVTGSGLPQIAIPVMASFLGFERSVVAPVEIRLPPRITRWTTPPFGLAAGALQGATGICGPVVQTYLHAYRLDKQAFVVSTVTVYGVFAVAQALTITGSPAARRCRRRRGTWRSPSLPTQEAERAAEPLEPPCCTNSDTCKEQHQPTDPHANPAVTLAI